MMTSLSYTVQRKVIQLCRPCCTKPGIERVQALAGISRSRYVVVVVATKPVYRLQIRPIMHNWGQPLPFPKVTSGSVQ